MNNTLSPQDIAKAFDEIRATLGPSFQLDEEGSCLVSYKDTLPVLIQYIEPDQRLVFASELASGLNEAPESEWLRLLSVDWLGFRTKGCALTPDFKSGTVLLWRDARLDSPTGESLEAELASFIRDVLEARERLASERDEEPSSPTISDMPSTAQWA
jgi:hypothetical protein